MLKKLVALMLASLLLCGAAFAAELPNPVSRHADDVTPLEPVEMDDGYTCWAWEHTFSSWLLEELMQAFTIECEMGGFELLEQNVDEDGDLVAYFSDGEHAFFIMITEEHILLCAPSDMKLKSISSPIGDGKLPIFNTPAPTEEPLTENFIQGYLNGELLTLTIDECDLSSGVYDIAYKDFTGRELAYRIYLDLPGFIRAGNTYRLDDKQTVENMKLMYQKVRLGDYITIYDCSYAGYTYAWGASKGDFVEVTIDSISKDGMTVKGRIEFTCAKGKYVFTDGVFAFTI